MISEKNCCGGALRDTIVHFGEGFEEDVFDAAVGKSKEADLSLCLGAPVPFFFAFGLCDTTCAGSKLSVTPACDMPLYALKEWQSRERPTTALKHCPRRSKVNSTHSGLKTEEVAHEQQKPRLAVCNLQRTGLDGKADLVIHHSCDEVMTGLLHRVKRKLDQRQAQREDRGSQ